MAWIVLSVIRLVLKTNANRRSFMPAVRSSHEPVMWVNLLFERIPSSPTLESIGAKMGPRSPKEEKLKSQVC